MSERFDLDDQAQLALDVARHAAVANGDSRCGTEYLLYGLVATASASCAWSSRSKRSLIGANRRSDVFRSTGPHDPE